VNILSVIVFGLAILTSASCMVLLFRGYARRRVRLLLWSGLCFVALTLNNITVFLDLVAFPEIDFRVLRLIASLVGCGFLLYAFIWDSETNRG